jgi:D-alanyl-D-alanine carboxypeptidase (penicillin-binding protein 5/6)
VGAAERNGRRLVATVLGAEARPLRGWQQGAALLDWGFALPRDARVGELVGATAAASAPPAAAPGDPAPARAPAPAAPAGTGVALALAVAAAVAATPALLLAVTRRNRPGGGRRQRAAVR